MKFRIIISLFIFVFIFVHIPKIADCKTSFYNGAIVMDACKLKSKLSKFKNRQENLKKKREQLSYSFPKKDQFETKDEYKKRIKPIKLHIKRLEQQEFSEAAKFASQFYDVRHYDPIKIIKSSYSTGGEKWNPLTLKFGPCIVRYPDNIIYAYGLSDGKAIKREYLRGLGYFKKGGSGKVCFLHWQIERDPARSFYNKLQNDKVGIAFIIKPEAKPLIYRKAFLYVQFWLVIKKAIFFDLITEKPIFWLNLQKGVK